MSKDHHVLLFNAHDETFREIRSFKTEAEASAFYRGVHAAGKGTDVYPYRYPEDADELEEHNYKPAEMERALAAVRAASGGDR